MIKLLPVDRIRSMFPIELFVVVVEALSERNGVGEMDANLSQSCTFTNTCSGVRNLFELCRRVHLPTVVAVINIYYR